MNFQEAQFVLLIGDFHVPEKAAGIPQCFRELLKTEKLANVVCTGNFGSKAMYDYIKSIGTRWAIVRGETDPPEWDLPESAVLKIGDVKIGVVSGYQAIPWGTNDALTSWLRRLDCDILVSGHSATQGLHAVARSFVITPGSVTGTVPRWTTPPTIPRILSPAAAETQEEEKVEPQLETTAETGTEAPATEAAAPTEAEAPATETVDPTVVETVEAKAEEVKGQEDHRENTPPVPAVEGEAPVVAEQDLPAAPAQAEDPQGKEPPQEEETAVSENFQEAAVGPVLPGFGLLTLTGKNAVVFFYEADGPTASVRATEFSL